MNRDQNFVTGFFVGVVMGIMTYTLATIFFKKNFTEELVSNKEIKPITKTTCIEVDGSKECDTTYTYKK